LGDHFESERYVFAGTDKTSDAVKTVPDWTYQPVTDAGDAAD
jgi:hypothetical protein